MDAKRLEDGGKRLRELAMAARAVGFELKQGQIDPGPADEDKDSGGWTSYGPMS